MNYKPELRDGKWFAVDRSVGVELACWFENEVTCEEIGRRTEAPLPESEYMNGVPVVPVDTPIPRPERSTDHPASVKRRLSAGEQPFLKRHRLNP